MSDRLVTVASFDGPTQAQMARSALESAGIRSVLTDEATVTLFWHMSNAIGGIKVQVMEVDATRALAILEETLGPDVSNIEEFQDVLNAEGEDPEDRVSEEPVAHAKPVRVEEEASIAPVPGSREDYARRLFFVAWLGLAIPPVWFYAFYTLLNAAFGTGTLTGRGRFNLAVGAVLTIVGMPLALFILSSLLGKR